MKNYRRKLSNYFDNEPTLTHCFNYKITKKIIYKKRVLDIGCWSGQFEKLAVNDAAEIVGIDPGKTAIEYARKRITKASFFVGNARSLHFKNGSFDVVTFFDVIEHLPINTEINALKEINRVLNRKGYLILSTPNKHFASILLDPAFFILKHRHYSQQELRSMLEKTGFKIESSFNVGGFFLLSTHILELILKHIFGKNFRNSRGLKKKIWNEYIKGGFASLYIIARKSNIK